MARGDWTSPAAYEELGSLDAPGFAWYLDRNPDISGVSSPASHVWSMRAAFQWAPRAQFRTWPRDER
jgi:hypothetical protein